LLGGKNGMANRPFHPYIPGMMFDALKAQVANAAEKLGQLRRFL